MNLNSESSEVWYGAHHHKSAQYTAFTQIHKTTQIRYEYVVYTERKKTQLLSLAALLIFRKHSNKCCVDCFWFAVFIDRFVYVHCESIVNAQAHIADDICSLSLHIVYTHRSLQSHDVYVFVNELCLKTSFVLSARCFDKNVFTLALGLKQRPFYALTLTILLCASYAQTNHYWLCILQNLRSCKNPFEFLNDPFKFLNKSTYVPI